MAPSDEPGPSTVSPDSGPALPSRAAAAASRAALRARLRSLAPAAALAAVALAVFWPARDFAFLSYDDWKHVRDNPELAGGLHPESLRRAFTPAFYHANWIPLTSISYLIDYEIAGLDAGRYHATNVWLHALASALLLLALRRLTGRPWPSAFAAGVFALHPLQVEAVAWISSRKDVLAGVFFASALFSHARYAERPTRARFVAVFASTLLALTSKQTTVTLPLVLLLLDFWPLGRLGGRGALPRLLAEKAILSIPVVAVCALVLAVQDVVWRGGHPVEVRLANAVESYWSYLGSALWPRGLAAFYPHPGGPSSAAGLLFAGFGLALASLVALGEWRRRPWLAVGWLWFLGMLVPVIGLVEVGLQARADRYMYLPIAGLALMAGFGADAASRGAPRARAALAVAASAALLLLAALSREQLEHWRDSASVYHRAVAVTEGNYVAHYGLAGVLAGAGDWEGARRELGLALRANPGWLLAHLRLAEVEIAAGAPERALEIYRGLLEQRPGDAGLHESLAGAALRAGEPRLALEHYGRAAEALGPASSAARDLVWLLATHPDAELRDPARALDLARRGLEASPGREPRWLDALAAAHAEAGDRAAALRLGEEATVLADAAGERQRADEIRARLARYRQGAAGLEREPPAPKVGTRGAEPPW